MTTAPDGRDWPTVDEELIPAEDRAMKVFDARVDAAAAQDAARQAAATAADQAEENGFRSTAAASRAADLANLQTFYEGLSTLAIGSVERTVAGAEVVQKASAAIVTLYTGLLGFVFVASDNPLPARGVLAPIFLGLAVVLSTAYLAYVGVAKESTPSPLPAQGVEPKVLARLNATVAAASKVATRRSYLLRSSVIALGVGLVYIALPFLSIGAPPSPGTPGAAPSTAAWPTPSTGIPDALNEIVYEAQVAEVAKAREAANAAAAKSPPVDDTGALFLLGLAGLAVTFLVPTVWTSGAVGPRGRGRSLRG